MKQNNDAKLGVFVVPTGIGASVGGYAGDAGAVARRFAQKAQLIVNPNVVNAGGFSAITDNMLYVEGYTLDSFFKGEVNLLPAKNNKIGIIYDKAIPQDVLNIHINTQNAVRVVYGINVFDYEITQREVGVEFFMTNEGISVGNVKHIETIADSCYKLLKKGCEAIAVVCFFEEPELDNPDYANGVGVDPVGGVEAIISHYVSKYFRLPCAHSPAFADYKIYPYIVNPKSASEYITPTFLPCILLGLANAPHITTNINQGINVNDVGFLVMPYDSLGSIPVIESLNRDIKIFAVKENTTQLNITNANLYKNSKIIEVDSYEKCLELI